MKLKVRGKMRTFAMPLGAIEDVSEVNDMPRQLGIALASGYAKKAEIVAIIEAAAKHGDAGVSVDDVYAEVGLSGMEKLALDLWLLAWKDDSGNSLAAGRTPGNDRSASADGSSPAE